MERIYDDSEKSEETSSLLYFVNEAVLLGFLWAKAEDEKNVKPNALAALEARKKSKSGGRESGKARRKKADEGWIAIAKKMAIAIRAKNPFLSQDRVAEEISFAWASEIRQRGHESLKRLVGQMEKSGELPKRQCL